MSQPNLSPISNGFANQFLLAMPGMLDDNFSGSLVYLLEHSDKGAMGLVVNRPTDIVLSTLFEKIELKLEIAPLLDQPVYFGGPVQVERGFVLHPTNNKEKYSSSLVVADGLTMTTSKDVLEAVAGGIGPEKFMMTLGYAGWGAGQLEEEISLNGWMNVELPSIEMQSIIFDTPYADRYQKALELLGINFASLSGEAGHA
jgi:putative transcriptional regulator